MIYYVGLNKEKIGSTKIFNGSITILGSNINNNYAYDKIYNCSLDYNNIDNIDKISKFYSEYMWKIIGKDKDAKFMFYSLVDSSKLDKELNKYVICNNKDELLAKLNNKIECREILADEISLLEYKYLKGQDISYRKIKSLLPGYARFVVQQPFGFAGFGTFLVDEYNYNSVIGNLKKEEVYSISGYEENAIPVNNTFLISEKNFLIFPGSCQIISANEQLNYDGFDFVSYENLDCGLKEIIKNQTMKICKRLQNLGYKGVGGADYIVKDNKVFFMEINPRFQASSTKLNDILIKKGYEDIYTLNLNSFYNEDNLPFEIED